MKPCLVVSMLALSVGTLLGPGAAWAGAFDGKWMADIPAETGACRYTGSMSLLVSGGDVSGQVNNSPDSPVRLAHLTGHVDPAGVGVFTVNGRYQGTLSFKGDHFEATWANGNCDRHAAGDRALDDASRARLNEERRRHQAAYAELVRRAEAGDRAVDYTLLRTESVYAKTWDYYDVKARGLLDQADAEVKGKDCTQAMTVLDQVIELDFTMDSAHSLRADCLRAAGKHDEARTEDAIAKGLIHSLMDSGKGDKEQTAYVVTTQREEMDVLANRKIQLKTRKTEVRGSDGRYFDLIHGVSIDAYPGHVTIGRGAIIGNGPSVDVRNRDFYFDISAFMAGRASRRAVAETTVAAIAEAQ